MAPGLIGVEGGPASAVLAGPLFYVRRTNSQLNVHKSAEGANEKDLILFSTSGVISKYVCM